ncbi:hypothetical protein BO71DRAFT_488286 [Aspergillus ellipticus CBS 707.79]|uniref:Uncharacterized protein n=1 Tax=Aspergillus ellipticus CBS 707.79 TaxID=1448320 RepID=A0A319D3E7_9EURO|nr:hypothetical protein BO71DRAFT_488286 [Aspergillus ellipticus CBS 707.79]
MLRTPRSAAHRRKKHDAADSVEFLNGIMRTRSSPKQPPPVSTPHPSRRRTVPGRKPRAFGDSPSFPQHSQLLTSPRTPRTEPPPKWVRSSKSPRLQRYAPPEPQNAVTEQSRESNEEESSEGEESSGDPYVDAQPRAQSQSEYDEENDEENDEEVNDNEIPRDSQQVELSGEGLRSDVVLFSSDNENSPRSSGPIPQSATGDKSSAAPMYATSQVNPIEANEDASDDEWVADAEPEADRELPQPNGVSPAETRQTLQVVVGTKRKDKPAVASTPPKTNQRKATSPITEPDEPSEAASPVAAPPATGSNQPSGPAAISDEEFQVDDGAESDSSIDQFTYLALRRLPSNISSPTAEREPSSPPADVAESSPPAKYSNKRRRTDASHQTTTSEANTEPRRRTPSGPQEPSSPASNSDVPDTQEQDSGPEPLEESSWFREASKHDGQETNWQKLTKRAQYLRTKASRAQAADFQRIKAEISSSTGLLRGICQGLQEGDGPSENDVESCAATLHSIAAQGRDHLDEVYHLSTGGEPRKAKRVVKGFEEHVLPPLVQLLLACFQAYNTNSPLFPEAYDRLDGTMDVLLQLCVHIHRLVQGGYVQYSAISSGLRLPLKKLRKSLEDDGWGGGALPEKAYLRRPRTQKFTRYTPRVAMRGWSQEEEFALIEGLQRFQGPDRYYQIWRQYREQLSKREMREVREESERLHDRILPQIAGSDRSRWEWLLKVRR